MQFYWTCLELLCVFCNPICCHLFDSWGKMYHLYCLASKLILCYQLSGYVLLWKSETKNVLPLSSVVRKQLRFDSKLWNTHTHSYIVFIWEVSNFKSSWEEIIVFHFLHRWCFLFFCCCSVTSRWPKSYFCWCDSEFFFL